MQCRSSRVIFLLSFLLLMFSRAILSKLDVVVVAQYQSEDIFVKTAPMCNLICGLHQMEIRSITTVFQAIITRTLGKLPAVILLNTWSATANAKEAPPPP